MKRIALLVLSALASVAQAADVTATWVQPTQYADSKALPLADITQTRLEVGTCSGTGATFGTKLGENVTTGTGTTAIFANVADGTYCFRSFTSAKGLESDASNVVRLVIGGAPAPQAKPKPGTLSVTVK